METIEEKCNRLEAENALLRQAYDGNTKVLRVWMTAYHKLSLKHSELRSYAFRTKV